MEGRSSLLGLLGGGSRLRSRHGEQPATGKGKTNGLTFEDTKRTAVLAKAGWVCE
jgi:hypothetical protein